jgi:hypothetical protein
MSELAAPDLKNLFEVWVGDNLPACGTKGHRVAVQLAGSGQLLVGAGDQEWLTPGLAGVGPFDHEPTVALVEFAASRVPQQLPETLGVPIPHGP